MAAKISNATPIINICSHFVETSNGGPILKFWFWPRLMENSKILQLSGIKNLGTLVEIYMWCIWPWAVQCHFGSFGALCKILHFYFQNPTRSTVIKLLQMPWLAESAELLLWNNRQSSVISGFSEMVARIQNKISGKLPNHHLSRLFVWLLIFFQMFQFSNF